MFDLEMKTVNETPWNLVAYSGYTHWDKPCYEDAFHTKREAEETARIIKAAHPRYWIEIFKED